MPDWSADDEAEPRSSDAVSEAVSADATVDGPLATPDPGPEWAPGLPTCVRRFARICLWAAKELPKLCWQEGAPDSFVAQGAALAGVLTECLWGLLPHAACALERGPAETLTRLALCAACIGREC